MARKPKEVEAAIELARAAGVSEALLERMGGYTGCVGVLDTGRPGPSPRFASTSTASPSRRRRTKTICPTARASPPRVPASPTPAGTTATRPWALGVAQWLADNKETLCGKVKLVFQPAEEGVRGAAAIAASGVLDDVDWFTAGHIGCDAKPGQVGVSHEGYLATTKFDLEIFGLPCAAGSPEKGHSALMCACNTVMALGSLPATARASPACRSARSSRARPATSSQATLRRPRGPRRVDRNQRLHGRQRRDDRQGPRRSLRVHVQAHPHGEAVTYKGDEEAVELVKAAARDAEGVTLVTDMNAKVGSEDCTMLIRRIQAHGGKCAFFYFGCDHHGHHRPDFEIQDRTSLPVGWGVFTGFVARTNAR